MIRNEHLEGKTFVLLWREKMSYKGDEPGYAHEYPTDGLCESCNGEKQEEGDELQWYEAAWGLDKCWICEECASTNEMEL